MADGRQIEIYKPHPLADLFPLMEGEPFWALAEDILANGIREPVVMLDGMVLDGRNRYRAAHENGVHVPAVEFEGDDPLAFVISLNLKRRHLSESQRGMVAAKLANLPRGRRDNSADVRIKPTAAQAAETLNVSTRTVELSRSVREHGTPSLVASVEAGDVSVSAAALVARLPEAVQAEIVDAGAVATREAAAAIRANVDVSKVRDQVLGITARGAERPPSGGNRNPNYISDPAYRVMLAVMTACRHLVEVIDQSGAETVFAGFLDVAMRERNLAEIGAARDALNTILESAHAEAS